MRPRTVDPRKRPVFANRAPVAGPRAVTSTVSVRQVDADVAWSCARWWTWRPLHGDHTTHLKKLRPTSPCAVVM